MEVVLETKMTAQAATTATLTPLVRSNLGKGDLADTVATVVVTFTTARDTVFFAELNREYVVTIQRR
jgi:hypothetical protein